MPEQESRLIESGTRRIAKNSLYLAIRTLFLALIQVYLSRVILNNLGVVDFGIYNVVGSVIIFWASARALFSSATQRYLNVAMGSGSHSDVENVFSVAFFLHIALSIIFLLVVGIIGLIAIRYYLVIPPDRIASAQIIFIGSLLASCFTIITSPFLSAIIAHERMDAYALATILESLGMLAVALLIPKVPIDKLIFYGLGVSVMSVFSNSIILLFARKHFFEVHANPRYDKGRAKELAAFAGWNFLGNTTFHFVSEGINFFLNIFFGPVLNAARGITNQVNSLVLNFSGTVITASNPQITHLAAQGNTRELNRLIVLSTKGVYCIALIIIGALYVSISEILTFWLGTVPPYTESFVKVIFVYGLIRCIHAPINSVFLAYAKMKKYQLLEMSILSCTLVFAYVALKFADAEPVYVFIIQATVDLINLIAIMILAKNQTPFDLKYFGKEALGRLMAVTLAFSILIYGFIHLNIHSFIVRSGVTAICGLTVFLILGFTSQERKKLIRLIVKK